MTDFPVSEPGERADPEVQLEREVRGRMAAEAKAAVALQARLRVEEEALAAIRRRATAEARALIEMDARERAEAHAQEESRLRHLAEYRVLQEFEARTQAENQIKLLKHARGEAELRARAEASSSREISVELETLKEQLQRSERGGAGQHTIASQVQAQLQAEVRKREIQIEQRLRKEYDLRLGEMISSYEQDLRAEFEVRLTEEVRAQTQMEERLAGENIASDALSTEDARQLSQEEPVQDDTVQLSVQVANSQEDAAALAVAAPSRDVRGTKPQSLKQTQKEQEKQAKTFLAEAKREEKKRVRERKLAWRKTRASPVRVFMWVVAGLSVCALVAGLVFFQPWKVFGRGIEDRMIAAGRVEDSAEFNLSITDMARLEQAMGVDVPTEASAGEASEWLAKANGQGADARVAVPLASASQITALDNLPLESESIVVLDQVTALEGTFDSTRISDAFGDADKSVWAIEVGQASLSLTACSNALCYWLGSPEVPPQLDGAGELLTDDVSAMRVARQLDATAPYFMSVRRSATMGDSVKLSSGEKVATITTAGHALVMQGDQPHLVLVFDHASNEDARANQKPITKAVESVANGLAQESNIEVTVSETLVVASVDIDPDSGGLAGPISRYQGLTM